MNDIKEVLAVITLDAVGLQQLETTLNALHTFDGMSMGELAHMREDMVVNALGIDAERATIQDARNIVRRIVDEDDALTADMAKVMFDL